MKIILMVDAVINLVLGVLLLLFLERLVQFLGVPLAEPTFYPNILGGVLFGIGIALLIECFRDSSSLVGLGLGGAIAINLSGGLVLLLWLILGDLSIPPHGQMFLWGLTTILMLISGLELVINQYNTRKAR